MCLCESDIAITREENNNLYMGASQLNKKKKMLIFAKKQIPYGLFGTNFVEHLF